MCLQIICAFKTELDFLFLEFFNHFQKKENISLSASVLLSGFLIFRILNKFQRNIKRVDRYP